MSEKELKKTTALRDFYLSVISMLKEGMTPTAICSKLSMTPQNLNYYLKPLRIENILIKIGYGVWEINENELKNFLSKELKKTTALTPNRLDKIFSSQKDIRGHGFRFKLLFKKPSNWHKRREYLKGKVEFNKIGINWQGESFLLGKDRIWLTPRSVIFHLKNSFLAETASSSKSHALYHFRQKIRQLENLLGLSFEDNKKYRFKVLRQHYAHIKDSLAKQYDLEGKRLYAYADDRSLCFIIDNSYNLNELEAVNTKTAVRDMDEVVKPFLLKLREKPFTSEDVYKSKEDIVELKEILKQTVINVGNLAESTKLANEQMLFMAENNKSHFEVLNGIKCEINNFSSKIDQLGMPIRKGYDPKIIISKIYKLQDLSLFGKEIESMTEIQKKEFEKLLFDKFSS